MNVACGQCIGCKLERSRQWAVRCMHEASLHDANCFLTLTYRDAPADGSVRVEHHQEFMKRLRRRVEPTKVRFFHCGEYGEVCAVCELSRIECRCPQFIEDIGRPHYHTALFGYDFPDKRRWKQNHGQPLYVSDQLDELWGHGYCTIGTLTFESAAYIARYCTKKINGDRAEGHYRGRHPEYITMSRRPGIGRPWLDKFSTDVYPDDTVIVRGRESRPPRAYDKHHAKLDAETHRRVQLERLARGNTREQKAERSSERLRVREVVTKAQMAVKQTRRFEK